METNEQSLTFTFPTCWLLTTLPHYNDSSPYYKISGVRFSTCRKMHIFISIIISSKCTQVYLKTYPDIWVKSHKSFLCIFTVKAQNYFQFLVQKNTYLCPLFLLHITKTQQKRKQWVRLPCLTMIISNINQDLHSIFAPGKLAVFLSVVYYCAVSENKVKGMKLKQADNSPLSYSLPVTMQVSHVQCWIFIYIYGIGLFSENIHIGEWHYLKWL